MLSFSYSSVVVLPYRGPSPSSALFIIVALLLHFALPAAAFLLDLDVPLMSPSFVYTPYSCNATDVDPPAACQGGWQMSKDADDHVRVMTTGSSSPILPQVFFRFRASNVYLTTTPDSNATVDVTVSSDSIMRKCTFDSAEGLMGITDLPDNSTMLLTLTVNPATTTATLFGLTSVKITTPPDATISSVLPPPTTPSPAISPTSSTPQTPNPSTNTSDSQVLKHQIIILALAITLGVGLGLPLLVVGGYLFLRWRRKRLRRKLAERWSFVLI